MEKFNNYRKILLFVFIGSLIMKVGKSEMPPVPPNPDEGSEFSCTNIYKKFREVTEWYQKAQIENMEQSQKIKQYEQLILKGYTENFETRKSLVDFEIDNLKANGKNLTTQLQQYQRDIRKIKQESDARLDTNSREIENLKLRLSAIESKPEIPPMIQRSSQSGVFFNYYGARQQGSEYADPNGNVRISYRFKGSESDEKSFDAKTGIFTTKSAGIYFFNVFHVNDDQAESRNFPNTRIKILVDESEACETYQHAFEDSKHYGTTASCSIIRKLSIGQTVRVEQITGLTDAGDSGFTNEFNSGFLGFKIADA